MRIFSESPLDRRDHTNRLSCHIIHEFRFSRIDFCSAARCRQRAGESGSFRRVAVQRDPRLLVLALERLEHAHRHGQPHDTVGVRPVETCQRILIHEFRFSRTIFALPHAFASARAKVASTTRPVPSRESPASTRPPRSRAPCPRSARRIARESSSPARRPSRGYTLPPMRPNPPSEGSAQAKAAPTTHFVPSR